MRHGYARPGRISPEWSAWASMRSRCELSTHPAYPRYGGRGIQVCARWGVFENFLADMGRRPSSEHSIDRIDNDRGYEPGNCRWATSTEQARNRRSNRQLTIEGVTMSMASWGDRSGVSARIIRDRLNAGWDLEEAVFTPRRPDDNLPPGAQFEGWTVLEEAGSSGGKRLYRCRCRCGTEQVLQGYDLRAGKSRQCRSCSLRGNRHAAS